MDIAQKIEILKFFPLFKDLDKNVIAEFAEKTHKKEFPSKTIILDQAQPSSSVYFMYKGLIRVYINNKQGRVIPIRVKGPMYVIGEMNLFDNESTASIETIQSTCALVASKEECLNLVMKNPIFSFNLLKNLNEKIRAANKQEDYYLSLRLKERTLGILQDLATYFPDNEITLSQEELSFIIGSSRARITEILAELATEKIIILSYRKIQVL